MLALLALAAVTAMATFVASRDAGQPARTSGPYHVAAVGNLCSVTDFSPLIAAFPDASEAQIGVSDSEHHGRRVSLTCVGGYDALDAAAASTAGVTLTDYGTPATAQAAYKVIKTTAARKVAAAAKRVPHQVHGDLKGIGDAALFYTENDDENDDTTNIVYTLDVVAGNAVLVVKVWLGLTGAGDGPAPTPPTLAGTQTAALAIATTVLRKAHTAVAHASGTSRYAMSQTSNLCDKLDLTPLAGAMPTATQPADRSHEENTDDQQLSCQGEYDDPVNVANVSAKVTVWYLPTPADAQAMWGQVRLHAAGSQRSGKTSGPINGVGDAAVWSGTPTTLGQSRRPRPVHPVQQHHHHRAHLARRGRQAGPNTQLGHATNRRRRRDHQTPCAPDLTRRPHDEY